MKLCVNYLEETKALLEEGKIDFIDYIKLFSINGDWSPLSWCIQHKDVMFHGIIGEHESNVGEIDFLKGRDLEKQREIFEISHTPYISTHINARYGEIPQEENALKIIVNNVEMLRKEFQKEIILENVPVQKDREETRFYSQPEFISKVIEETGCGFLLDIGHARVAADRLHIQFEEYINQLPMHRLVETHLAGCMECLDGDIIANHSKMNEEDYVFLENLLKETKTLRVVTLEYGTIKEGLTKKPCPVVQYGTINVQAKTEVYEQLMRLKEMIR